MPFSKFFACAVSGITLLFATPQNADACNRGRFFRGGCGNSCGSSICVENNGCWSSSGQMVCCDDGRGGRSISDPSSGAFTLEEKLRLQADVRTILESIKKQNNPPGIEKQLIEIKDRVEKIAPGSQKN